jgi:hypothetical protein
MTSASFSSGEILDIMKALEIMESKADYNEDYYLAAYYMSIGNKFQNIYDKLQELPGEQRVLQIQMK